jgi:hypothetical protein
MACLVAGTRFTKSLVLFGGWQAACRLDCYKILLAGTSILVVKSLVLFGGWQAACRLDCYKILHGLVIFNKM